MILSWCIVVKDDSELDNLKGAIGSIYDYVDEIIVVANGKRVKNIEKLCSLNKKIKYYYLKWKKDFAEQRNYCASKVRKDADYYGWMDADDVVVGAELLRKLASTAKKNNFDTVFFTYWYGCSFNGKPSAETMKEVELNQTRERFLKPNTTVWKKRIHETPVPVDNLDYKYSRVRYSKEFPIAWLHLGADRKQPEEVQEAKMARNQEMLELELEDERKEGQADPRTLLYLMKVYAERDSEKLQLKNIEMGREYLAKSGWDAERAKCCALMGRSLGKLGREREAKDFLFSSIKEYPYDPLLYLYLARSCYNLGQFRETKHWLNTALTIDSQKSITSMNNLLELKVLSSELTMKYYLSGEKDVRKAYKSAKFLYKEVPSENNRKNVEYLGELVKLDKASEEAHKLMLFYEDLKNSQGIVDIFESMPPDMKKLPFAWHMYNKHKVAKTWGKDEICYYATFGKPHFEQWSPNSLKKGLGGSETAVIKLSEEWAKKGYKVTVYCDCGEDEGVYNGVKYVPYYKFNHRDNFNIFINWRSNHLAGRIKAKKFFVDLHDLFAELAYKDYDKYDRLFVKSQFHRNLAKHVPDSKMEVISNGI